MKDLDLTKERAIKEHRKMWNWIADQLENGRSMTIGTLKEVYCDENEFDILNNCFCCEFDAKQSLYCCENCPILWGTENIVHDYYCETGMTDYKTETYFGEETGLWMLAENLTLEHRYKEAAEIARQIANLPERQD